jgi:hypothetical protein
MRHMSLRPGVLALQRGIGFLSETEILDAVLRCCEDALGAAATGQEMDTEVRAAEAAGRIRHWITDDARHIATVGVDFDPEQIDGYDVIRDRDRGEAAALVLRERLVGPAGGEQALSAALGYAKQKGWLLPNRETGAATRQKRFAGTDSRPRFVFFREAFLGAAERKAW